MPKTQARIERLTPEQTARFPEFIKKWTDYGLSTEKADRPKAEAAIRKSYEIAGLPHPERIVWCDSPLTAGLTRAIVMGLKDAEVKTGASVWDSVRASVWDSVGDSVRASVGDSVWASVRASVGASVGASVWDSVRASVGDSVRASVRASVWASGYGQHDAYWLAFYDYFRDACGLSEQTQKLTGLWELAQSANWWLPHEKICWVSERHHVLNRDSGGRLHCENGPALSYPDGFSIYSWHGLTVDQSIIEHPELITVQQIENEANAEIRRVLIERYGQGRYLVDSGAKEVHRDDWGVLYIKEIPDDEPLVMVKVVNPTPEPDGSFRDYFLRVAPECAGKRRLGTSVQTDPGRKWTGTAHDAVAWTNYRTEKTYQPLVET